MSLLYYDFSVRFTTVHCCSRVAPLFTVSSHFRSATRSRATVLDVRLIRWDAKQGICAGSYARQWWITFPIGKYEQRLISKSSFEDTNTQPLKSDFMLKATLS